MTSKTFKVIYKFSYIITFLLGGILFLGAQVSINEDVTISSGTTFYIKGEDVNIQSNISGEGKIIVRAASNVVINGKKVQKNTEIKNIGIEIEYLNKVENQMANVNTNELKIIAKNKRLASFELVEKPEDKIFGSIEIKRIYEEIENSHSSTNGFLPQWVNQLSFTVFDNYLIPNDNYLLITKERVVGSQNLHDTLFVKSFLDPPENLI